MTGESRVKVRRVRNRNALEQRVVQYTANVQLQLQPPLCASRSTSRGELYLLYAKLQYIK
jgi:hypothetical protein